VLAKRLDLHSHCRPQPVQRRRPMWMYCAVQPGGSGYGGRLFDQL
jgi:hypothetical protein